MRILNYDIAVHWGGSFACVSAKRKLYYEVNKIQDDIYIQLGGLLIIVSNFNKANEHDRRIP